MMNALKSVLLSIPIAAATMTPLPLLAMDGAELYVTKTCVACHGKDADTPILPIYPKLAGQSPDYAYNQMVDIKSGARDNGMTAAMRGVMHLVTEEEMRVIADWLATLK
ncbi:c-type cytochrome [Thiocapsa rosea]|uniref:Cytochrome c n=1 Tax=Thiocapsa rosea TaxID=69360 RepID=A0A495V2Q1_9GAMM|nr:c-type cytochrome [Thiocapsa rosea]RKT43599.1 cytochrome c [Thiocapsa rosea]